jgi:type III secretion protein C
MTTLFAPFAPARLVLALALAGLVPVAAAAEPASPRAVRRADAPAGVAWPVARFVYKADNKRLADLLSDFAASQGLAAVIADGVDGVVAANFDASPNEFLSAISKAYGVIWYFDGAAVYFYPSRAIQSRIFRLKGYSGQQVEQLLRSLRLADSRYPLRYDQVESTLLVYGPPRHVELVSAAVESMDVGASESNKRITRVVPLRFAWAADRKLGDKSLPGVATLVRNLYGQSGGEGGSSGSAPAGADINTFTAKSVTQQKMWGLDKGMLQAPKAPESGAADMSGKSITGNGPRGVRSPMSEPQDVPSVQADEATNSVVINGRRDNMDEYVEPRRR